MSYQSQNHLSILSNYSLPINNNVLWPALVAATFGAYMLYRSRQLTKDQILMLSRLRNQSIILDEKEGIRGSPFCKNGELHIYHSDNITTLYEAFENGCNLSGDKPCLGWRPSPTGPFVWITYNEVKENAHLLGSALVTQLNIKPGSETFVGIYGQNCKEWYISELAVAMYSMVIVPLYDTLGKDACAHIISQVSMELIFCESNAKVSCLLEELPSESLATVKHLILFEEVKESTRQLVQLKYPRMSINSIHQLQEMSLSNRIPMQPPKSSDLFTICYTSGTTGSPKGVMLTHENFLSMVSQTIALMYQAGIRFGPNHRHISFLPLAHMFEQSAHLFIMMHGARLGYYGGDIRRLVDDVKELKPTFFFSVPRVLSRIYDKSMSQINRNFISKFLYKCAIHSKISDLKRGIMRQDTIWDKLIFQKIRDSLGGQVQVILTGSAPLSTDVMNFIRCAFSCNVFEAYGQTECTAAVCCTLPGDYEAGCVGPPLACNHVKLIDVPDMNLNWRRDGRGEICVRGPNCSAGYYKLPDKTRETIDEEGWVHTGDIGLWTESGSLKIVDRCKHIFKLSQGEYVSPERIEQCLQQNAYIQQIFVDGNSLQSFCVAVVVLDPETIPTDWKNAFTNNSSSVSQQQQQQQQLIKMKILQSLNDTGRKCGLKGFEMVKDIYISNELFSLENDLMTPTMKLKRPQLRARFANEITQMYNEPIQLLNNNHPANGHIPFPKKGL